MNFKAIESIEIFKGNHHDDSSTSVALTVL